ncbi:MAG: molecular chaperone HtpG [Kiritimatiellia bacterium]
MAKTTHQFKAEISRMLDLVIHSLYSKKEIFLRELVSNASDAIDRARYGALTDKSLADGGEDYRIDITVDKPSKTITIADNGIGMTAEELEKNLGTIASSGTKAFTEALRKDDKSDIPELIGQFGVGFYAAFMVAEAVTVETLHRGNGQTPVCWRSAGDGSYELDESTKKTPGTTIVLRLREDQDEYLSRWRIESLVRQYSDFIAYPIYVTETGEKDDKKDDKPQPVNTRTALWKRNKAEVKPEEYEAFYKHLAHESEAPWRTIHYRVEGSLEFQALLFIPAKPGFDLMMPESRHGLKLYARNVYIGSDFKELLPEYLRFVRGVVDSSDLPLNISREMLQDDSIIRRMRTNLTGRILKELADVLKESPDAYRTFYKAFGPILKEGIHTDWENKDKLKNLLLAQTAKSPDGELLTLQAYRDAMPKEQKAIYYLVATDAAQARQSPHLEGLLKRGYDVLLLTDPVDEWIAEDLGEFDKLPVLSAAKADLDLGDEAQQKADKQKQEQAAKDLEGLAGQILKRHEADLSAVQPTTRLTDSPCRLAPDPAALAPQVERMMRAMGQEVPKSKRILQLNPDHPLVQKMDAAFKAAPDSQELADDIDLLYAMALVAEGLPLPDPAAFSRTLAKLMVDRPAQ